MKQEKIIFWNVDTQYDFMRESVEQGYKGQLPVKGAILIEPNLQELTDYALKNNIRVINTADMHDENTKEISENPDFINTFPEHCMRGTLGAAFVPATTNPIIPPYIIDWKKSSPLKFDSKLVKRAKNITLFKDHFDIFQGNPYADKVVKTINPKKAVVYGVAANVCVDFAVLGLLERKVQVYVPLDAIKELPGLPLPYDNWKKAGANLITTQDVLEGRM
ncbi:MAG: cysteine hydrolase family protein [Nanoarchaeota archaeon]|nr:cysteine hydrolase family protein [Nanoarchaeota archaeon]